MIDQFFEYLTSEGFEYKENRYVKDIGEFVEVYSTCEEEDKVLHQLLNQDGTINNEETITLTF
jgi:hypothetical protein